MGANLSQVLLEDTNIKGAQNLDLYRYITELDDPTWQKDFLDSQKAFLDSLSPKELAAFNLSPEKLARIRSEASGG
jgi:hypothetical protein